MTTDIARPYTYKVTFTSGEYYFGYRFANVKKNRPAHLDLGTYYKTSSKIIKERGFENCTFEVLSEFDSKFDAYWSEQRAIKNNKDDPLILNKHYIDPDSGKGSGIKKIKIR